MLNLLDRFTFLNSADRTAPSESKPITSVTTFRSNALTRRGWPNLSFRFPAFAP